MCFLRSKRNQFSLQLLVTKLSFFVHACCGKAFVIADLGTISFPKVLDEIPIGSAQQITIYCHISQMLMPYKNFCRCLAVS